MALVFSVAAALASVFTPAALVLNDGVRIAQIVFYVLAAVLAGISCIFAVRNYHVDVGEASPRHEIAKISICGPAWPSLEPSFTWPRLCT